MGLEQFMIAYSGVSALVALCLLINWMTEYPTKGAIWPVAGVLWPILAIIGIWRAWKATP